MTLYIWVCDVNWSECRCVSECGITSEDQAELASQEWFSIKGVCGCASTWGGWDPETATAQAGWMSPVAALISQIFLLAEFLLSQNWKQVEPLFSVFMWVLCVPVLCVDRCINTYVNILYNVKCQSGIGTQPPYWRECEIESELKFFSNLNASMNSCLRDAHRRQTWAVQEEVPNHTLAGNSNCNYLSETRNSVTGCHWKANVECVIEFKVGE